MVQACRRGDVEAWSSSVLFVDIVVVVGISSFRSSRLFRQIAFGLRHRSHPLPTPPVIRGFPLRLPG